MVFVHDATNKILSHEWKYNVIVVMWPNFGDSNIFRKKLSKLHFYKDLTSKFNLLEEGTLCPILDWIDCIFYINLKRLYVYVNLFLKLFGFFIFELKVFLKVILKPLANFLWFLGHNYWIYCSIQLIDFLILAEFSLFCSFQILRCLYEICYMMVSILRYF